MELSSYFNHLGFHDASIESVLREDDRVEVRFDFVIIASEHPEADGRVIEIKGAKVIFTQVTSEKAVIWHDDKSPIEHPNPDIPILEVMHGTQHDDCFHFDGFWQSDDWSEWYIYSNNFVLSGEANECSRVAF